MEADNYMKKLVNLIIVIILIVFAVKLTIDFVSLIYHLSHI